MKVAYNNCYGGFSLSPLAETEYQKKKGIDLTWYIGQGKIPYSQFIRIDEDLAEIDARSVLFSLTAATEDLGKQISEIPNGKRFYESWYGEENRNDPDLIEVIERLGDKANGVCADLAIKEIPDGADYEITEYDGNEDVMPPRMSW